VPNKLNFELRPELWNIAINNLGCRIADSRVIAEDVHSTEAVNCFECDLVDCFGIGDIGTAPRGAGQAIGYSLTDPGIGAKSLSRPRPPACAQFPRPVPGPPR